MALGRKFGEDALMSPETGNWNVASEYSKLKIMKNLYLADQYEIIATFGTINLEEELQVNFNPDFLRIRAFRRFVKTLSLLIDNSKFAIKHKKDKALLIKYRKTLKQIYSMIPDLFYYQTNQVTKRSELIIYQKKYYPLLDIVIQIKASINDPLNRSDLLFLNKEEFDPFKQKKEIMKRVIEKG